MPSGELTQEGIGNNKQQRVNRGWMVKGGLEEMRPQLASLNSLHRESLTNSGSKSPAIMTGS